MYKPYEGKTFMEMLYPPKGFEFYKCVITTYSLDLFSLVNIIFCCYGTYTSKKEDNNFLWANLKNIPESFRVLHNPGSINIHNLDPIISRLIDKCIMPVKTVKENESFHPKIILVRYKKKGGKDLIRLIISSKNLSESNYLEAGILFESVSKKKNYFSGAKLQNFFENHWKSKPKESFKHFFGDITNIHFAPLHSNNSVELMFKTDLKDSLDKFSQKIAEAIIVSPFLDNNFLETILKLSKKSIVISIKESLDKINLPDKEHELIQYSNATGVEHKIDPFAEAYKTIPNECKITDCTSLHSKIIFLKFINGDCRLFIGSANATNRGWSRNEECVVCIKDAGSLMKEFKEGFIFAKDKELTSWLESYQRQTIESDKPSPEEEKLRIFKDLVTRLEFKLKIHKKRLILELERNKKILDKIKDLFSEGLNIKEIVMSTEDKVRYKLTKLFRYGKDSIPNSLKDNQFSRLFIIDCEFKGKKEKVIVIVDPDNKLYKSRASSLFKEVLNMQDLKNIYEILKYMVEGREGFVHRETNNRLNSIGSTKNYSRESFSRLFETIILSSTKKDKNHEIVEVFKELIKKIGKEELYKEDLESLKNFIQGIKSAEHGSRT